MFLNHFHFTSLQPTSLSFLDFFLVPILELSNYLIIFIILLQNSSFIFKISNYLVVLKSYYTNSSTLISIKGVVLQRSIVAEDNLFLAIVLVSFEILLLDLFYIYHIYHKIPFSLKDLHLNIINYESHLDD